MTTADLIDLTKTTLRDPAAGARRLIGWQLPRDVLWTTLALVAAINTLLIQFLLSGSPPNPAIPAYFNAPLTLFVLMAGVMVIYIHALYWSGLAINGQGPLDDLLAVMVWLQVLRSVAQLAIVMVSILVPGLGMFVAIAASVWGFWILLNFIATALNLPTPLHGLMVLVIGIVGLVLSLSILLAVLGVGAQGTPQNV